MRFLLDSVILIDHFNNISAATDFLQENQTECAISVITRAEVLAGFAPAEAATAIEFLNLFPTLEVTIQVADLAANLRRQERWRWEHRIFVKIFFSPREYQISNLKHL